MKTYVIPGNPLSLSRVKVRNADFSHSQRLLHGKCKVFLESQHGDLPKYKGPLHIDVTFFMHVPEAQRKNRKSLEGTPFTCSPLLADCFMIIEHFAHETLFDDASYIFSINAKKIYSLDARTEFTVREVV